ncbi:MAG: enoyl-CoA hydratase-related protein [bacterium]|nr:enoyl-CoA hydratase-related protein [bacterium]
MAHLLCETENGVATLTLNRPGVRNAVDAEIMDGLSEQADRLAAEGSLRAVLLTGAGEEAFCAGGDLKWLRSFDTPEKGAAMSRRMQDILRRLAHLPVPLICVLNGYALGGGAEITLACDIRVMESHAWIAFRQARIALMTGWGGGGRLIRLIGHAKAMELLAAAPEIRAEEAKRIGLVNTVVPKGEGLAEARRMAAGIAQAPAPAIRAIKKYFLSLDAAFLADASEKETEIFSTLWNSASHDEAIRAFIEKRAPEFKK